MEDDSSCPCGGQYHTLLRTAPLSQVFQVVKTVRRPCCLLLCQGHDVHNPFVHVVAATALLLRQ